jgi:hypothetical protein
MLAPISGERLRLITGLIRMPEGLLALAMTRYAIMRKQPFLSVSIQAPAGYTANNTLIGLDGDGENESQMPDLTLVKSMK